MSKKKDVKKVHGDDSKSIKKAVRHAIKGHRVEIYNSEGHLLSIGRGEKRFHDDESIDVDFSDTPVKAKKAPGLIKAAYAATGKRCLVSPMGVARWRNEEISCVKRLYR